MAPAQLHFSSLLWSGGCCYIFVFIVTLDGARSCPAVVLISTSPIVWYFIIWQYFGLSSPLFSLTAANIFLAVDLVVQQGLFRFFSLFLSLMMALKKIVMTRCTYEIMLKLKKRKEKLDMFLEANSTHFVLFYIRETPTEGNTLANVHMIQSCM